MRRFDLSVYLVADPAICSLGLLEAVREAVAGGVTMVQLRDKTGSTAERTAAARALKGVLAGSGVPLLVNDDIEAALAADADGVHIGQDDGDPQTVRDAIGPDRILGLSVETVGLARAAHPAADYLGVGPVFATATKPGHAPPLGFEGLAEIVAATDRPTVAIGGLQAIHAPRITADGIAVVTAICAASDPRAAAREIAEAMARARAPRA
ncbi:thiamine phosphate synthase [Acuticoccus sp. M5D2P5]|uniref:thiamine phosphate synthase n=1 Tax=Acuticoccus kalidii TaxID=2910977 RepID=UPI001F193B4C|nr:thiamine phosphate synthase [Acuticoccus kalidii]MCF3933181.1 thiamine phosphate synthase [Acuticoccus kalidii]